MSHTGEVRREEGTRRFSWQYYAKKSVADEIGMFCRGSIRRCRAELSEYRNGYSLVSHSLDEQCSPFISQHGNACPTVPDPRNHTRSSIATSTGSSISQITSTSKICADSTASQILEVYAGSISSRVIASTPCLEETWQWATVPPAVTLVFVLCPSVHSGIGRGSARGPTAVSTCQPDSM